MMPTPTELVATLLFALAIIHTFSTGYFSRLAHTQPHHAGLWHLLGEVEVVFGFWAFILIGALFFLSGKDQAIQYLDSRNFTEPLFVFAIMVIAASRPILFAIRTGVRFLAGLMLIERGLATYFLCLGVVPILGSFITEPAAMTIAALLLRDAFFRNGLSHRLQYATLGTLFVNISIGGTLTHFAAPPVLMVAATWQWDTSFMMLTFGWKALLAVLINALVCTFIFRKEIKKKTGNDASEEAVPATIIALHLSFLAAVVFFAHHATVFMGLFLLFLGYTDAYPRHQDRLILREGLLVAFFLAGLVTLGGLQKWWLQPALSGLNDTVLFFMAMALTAVTDNAALTYLGSLVEGVSTGFKYALVAGAVAGGGLTVIANAPNPAGLAIFKSSFQNETVSPLRLLLAALPPSCMAVLAFLLL